MNTVKELTFWSTRYGWKKHNEGKGKGVVQKLQSAIEQTKQMPALPNACALHPHGKRSKTISIEDLKASVEGWVRNWNNKVQAITTSQSQSTVPHSKPRQSVTPFPTHDYPIAPETPLVERRKFMEMFNALPKPDLPITSTLPHFKPPPCPVPEFAIEPPMPEQRYNKEVDEESPSLRWQTNMGSTTAVLKDENSDVELIGTVQEADLHSNLSVDLDSMSMGTGSLKRKCPKRWTRTFKMAMTTVDIEDDALVVNKRVSTQIMQHWHQKSRSSVTPMESDGMTGDGPDVEPTWGGICFNNIDLPKLFFWERKWVKNMLPTLILWLGDQPDIWAVPKDSLVLALHETVKANNCLSSWHHLIGYNAIQLWESFLIANTPAIVAACPVPPHMCSGSMNVPRLNLDVKQIKAERCYCILEHALTLIKLGVIPIGNVNNAKDKGKKGKGCKQKLGSSKNLGSEYAFSEQHWGVATSSYFQLVAVHEP
ncbi:hypothetical protein EDC04DRAFT_2599632 [Pisolithus marmoratus]|nr:hypothetical protein EDC04DRAFT_2599632 [Pisolithus marmoratus]